MPVPIDNIEKHIETITKILISKEKDERLLWSKFRYFTKLLSKKKLLTIEYSYPIEKLIKLFEEKKVIIPKKLNKALGNVLMKLDDDYNNSQELNDVINDCLNTVDILGEPAY